MHQYDSVLKSLLTGSQNSFFKRLTNATHGHWLNVELPRVTQRRVDLLFQVVLTLELILIELQSQQRVLGHAERSKLTMLAGLRNLAGEVQQEAKRMPIHYDIRDHETIGPMMRQERAEGEARGLTICFAVSGSRN